MIHSNSKVCPYCNKEHSELGEACDDEGCQALARLSNKWQIPITAIESNTRWGERSEKRKSAKKT